MKKRRTLAWVTDATADPADLVDGTYIRAPPAAVAAAATATDRSPHTRPSVRQLLRGPRLHRSHIVLLLLYIRTYTRNVPTTSSRACPLYSRYIHTYIFTQGVCVDPMCKRAVSQLWYRARICSITPNRRRPRLVVYVCRVKLLRQCFEGNIQYLLLHQRITNYIWSRIPRDALSK